MITTSDKSRRDFIKKTTLVSAGTLAVPTIVPSTIFGKNAPSNRINIGMIGTGRHGIGRNLRMFLELDNCLVTALNDPDSWRMERAKERVDEVYSKQKGKNYAGTKMYNDYRDLLADQNVDAVMISSPDHWHVPHGIAAAFAGKHVSVEKALSVCFSHSKALVEAVKKTNVRNRLDSEFRTVENFWRGVEIVHNGLIGKVKHVEIGVPAELSGSAVGPQPIMPVPEDLNYDMWLGVAFPAPYTHHRVHHPRDLRTRPGWMRINDYCNGMITNWGAHLCDIAVWGIRKEFELPKKVSGTGTFSKGLWNTIETFSVDYEYADGVTMRYSIDEPFTKFIGENGWVKVGYRDILEVSNPEFLKRDPAKMEFDYSGVLSDKADFLQSIKTGEESLQPIEGGHIVYFINVMGLIAVKLGRELTWDNEKQLFVDDTAANTLLNRPIREKWLDADVAEWINKYQKVPLS